MRFLAAGSSVLILLVACAAVAQDITPPVVTEVEAKVLAPTTGNDEPSQAITATTQHGMKYNSTAHGFPPYAYEIHWRQYPSWASKSARYGTVTANDFHGSDGTDWNHITPNPTYPWQVPGRTGITHVFTAETYARAACRTKPPGVPGGWVSRRSRGTPAWSFGGAAQGCAQRARGP